VILLAGWVSLVCLSVRAQSQGGSSSPEHEARPTETTIRDELASGDPRQVAWGAHDVVAMQDRDLIPDLLDLAARWQPSPREPGGQLDMQRLTLPEQDREAAMAAVLDALIQMRVAVPAEAMLRVAPDFGNDVAVLLSRVPAEQSGALRMQFFQTNSSGANGLRVVSAELMAGHPEPGFAAELLTGTRVDAYVAVLSPGGGDALVRGQAIGCGSGEGVWLRRGWPQIGMYILLRESTQEQDTADKPDKDTEPADKAAPDSAANGAQEGTNQPQARTPEPWKEVLVSGPVERMVATRRLDTRYSEQDGVWLMDEDRLRLVAQMLGVSPEAIPWKLRASGTIVYESGEQYRDALLRWIESQQAMYRETSAALTERGAMTASEAGVAMPQMVLEVSDQRGMAELTPIQRAMHMGSKDGGGGLAPLPKPDLPSGVTWHEDPN
jgi:hypothetical protein